MDGKNVDKRDSILKLQMDEREKEFTTLQNFKIFVGKEDLLMLMGDFYVVFEHDM